ncbi:MAG: hypothetical protein QOG49_927, partial [Frankiaceae bacterium]|nr:hypothetical protein [Frankiaceae bacterium]
LPALALDSARNAAAGMAAGTAPQVGAPKIAQPVGGGGSPTVTIKGQLPAATDALFTAYRVQRRAVTRDDVAKLAAALGVKGEPRQQGGSWVVSDGKTSVTVDPTPTLDWRLMPGDGRCGFDPGFTGQGGGTGGTADPTTAIAPVPPDATVTGKPAPDASAAGKLVATAPAAGKPAPNAPVNTSSVNPDGPETMPSAIGCAGGAVGSGVACAAGTETLVACTTPPAAPLPSEDVARAAALGLLKSIGLTADAADVRSDDGYDGVRHVVVRRTLDGRPVDGLASEVGVDAGGKVVTASGQLAEPVAAGEYPMVSAAELAQTLVNTRVRMMMCVRDPNGGDGCAPPPPIVVTGATAGLSLVYPVDYDNGEAYLLPAWLFAIEGDPAPTAVVAVPDKYRSKPEPQPTTGKDTIEPAPLPTVGSSGPAAAPSAGVLSSSG